ncbi:MULTISPECIES: glycosyltransferase [unclassified Sinorhizobium]|uniref:glycosyltransferase n=1 Tax=unclassified Sinorhizobium TaxID=2613772 RepID=UPI003525192E
MLNKGAEPVLVLEFHEDQQWLGGAIYIDNLLAALSSLPDDERPEVHLKLLSSPRTSLARKLFGHSVVAGSLPPSGFSDIAARTRRFHRAAVRRWPLFAKLTPAARRHVYFPAFDAWQRWRNNLYWIPDFQLFHFPELFDRGEIAARRGAIDQIAASRGLLVLSSEAALADFRKLYPAAAVEPRVWSFSSSLHTDPGGNCDATLTRYQLPQRFLYVANHFWRHKDHLTVFKALKLLKERGTEVFVVCTGLQFDRRDPEYFNELMQMLASWGLLAQIRLLGVVPRGDQAELFRAAVSVVQPSLFEGWSTVIEDAKALGRPIVASDIPVHVEQLDGLANCILFEKSNAEDLAQKLAFAWTTMAPGPAVEQERAAIARRDAVRIQSARDFVRIVKEAASFELTN